MQEYCTHRTLAELREAIKNDIRDIRGEHFGKHRGTWFVEYSCAWMQEDDIFNISSEESPEGPQ